MNCSRCLAVCFRFLVLSALVHASFVSVPWAEAKTPQTVDYGPAIAQLNQAIEKKLEQGELTGLSVAIVDGQKVVHAAGYGLADKKQNKPATADTVYRVGSISKLFTALSAMQLVEQGKLDLDAPIQKAVSDFSIVVPFDDAGPITLRQLMCHRSGLVRESPVGGYLDDDEPGIAASVASLADCVLVNPPNRHMRYSNIGVTLVGHAVEKASGLSFEEYQRQNILGPLGMEGSSWKVDQRVRDQLATSYMRVADDHGGFYTIESPLFELGTIPAGNLYSSAKDMAKFAKMLLAHGALPEGKIVKPETLDEMTTVQLTEADAGFGLGFSVGKQGKHDMIRHSGAVYGFSCSTIALPKAQMAVIVLSNEDIVSGRVKEISDAAFDAFLAVKHGEQPQKPTPTVEISTEELQAFVGDYESVSYWAKVTVEGGTLAIDVSGQPLTTRPIGPNRFEFGGRRFYKGILEFQKDDQGKVTGFRALDQNFVRANPNPPKLPESWHKYLGSYGDDFIPVVISEHHGHLYAMTENLADYRLTPLNSTVFKMPPGLYTDEQLVFHLDPDGNVYAVTLANMTLPRRP